LNIKTIYFFTLQKQHYEAKRYDWANILEDSNVKKNLDIRNSTRCNLNIVNPTV
jgi:hypothetical protein